MGIEADRRSLKPPRGRTYLTVSPEEAEIRRRLEAAQRDQKKRKRRNPRLDKKREGP
jgi:hypothetical protein